MKFTTKENKVLTETYRRLNYFHKGNINERLLLLATPYQVKSLIEKGVLTTYSSEVKRANNWYSLTADGKDLFKKYAGVKISEDENFKMFKNEKIINFSF